MTQGEGKDPPGAQSPRFLGRTRSPANNPAEFRGGNAIGFRQGKYIRFSRAAEVPHLTDAERAKLASTIRISVVPELKHRIAGNAANNEDSHAFVEIDLDGLVRTLLDREQDSFKNFLHDMDLLRDAPAHVCDQLVRSLITRVGEMWSDDTTGFYEVTLAAARLQTFLRERVQQGAAGKPAEPKSRRIMLAKISGEEHTLGLLVVTACFQEAGWEVSGGAELEIGPRLFRELERERYGMLGLSVGVSVDIPELSALITKARKVSRNGDLGVCIGGPALMTDRDRFQGLDVDFIATDALSAVQNAEACLG
jgi:methanogenic corrinoid protein MtbC1